MNLKDMKEMIPGNVNELLNELGLERRRSSASYVIPAIGVFAAGALAGGLLILAFAPKTAKELRGEIERRLGRDGQSTGNEFGEPNRDSDRIDGARHQA